MRIPRKRDCLGEENKKFTPNFRGDNHQVHLSKEGADEVVLLMVTFQRQAYTSDVFGWVELNTAILEEFRQATVRVLKKSFSGSQEVFQLGEEGDADDKVTWVLCHSILGCLWLSFDDSFKRECSNFVND